MSSPDLYQRTELPGLTPSGVVYDDGHEPDAGAWELIECAVDLIAGHYRLSRDLVWAAVFELEDSWEAQSGLSNFGALLDQPWGFTTLGIRVAQAILGEAEAAALPPLMLSYH